MRNQIPEPLQCIGKESRSHDPTEGNRGYQKERTRLKNLPPMKSQPVICLADKALQIADSSQRARLLVADHIELNGAIRTFIHAATAAGTG